MTERSGTGSSLLEKAEYFIYLAAGYILVIAAGGLLISAVIEMVHKILESHYTEGLIHLLDRVLLALMIAEIIYTVGRIARTQKLEVTPFLIVGIIAAVRRMLIITAESTEHMDFGNPAFQAAFAELGLLAVIIFLLAWAIRLLEHERQ
ncbi:MAG: phosphate-starvation-inducible PsiE family protein [Pseudomonadota bacterium]|nr:phosphate-starvation-inducible PsiE family protein [Pseudomonadota bacterium]